MRNIVTGEDNDPRSQQDDRPNLPRGRSPAPEIEFGQPLPTGDPSGTEPVQEGTVAQPSPVIDPLSVVGMPPWVQGNPNVNYVLPDIPSWRDSLVQQTLQGAPRTEQVITDFPNAFEAPIAPLATFDYGSKLQQLIDQRNASELQYSNLGGSLGGFLNRTSPGSPSREDIPRSTEPVVGGLYPLSRDGNFTSTTANQLGQLGELLGSLTRFNPFALTWETGRRVLEGEGVWEAFRDSSREAVGGIADEAIDVLDSWTPRQNPDGTPVFDVSNDEYGEFGRGIVGAGLYGLAMVENLGWATVYSLGDFARHVDSHSGATWSPFYVPPEQLEDRSPFFRYQQVFRGVDLDPLNIRDGTEDRYLSTIPVGEDVPLWQTIAGVAGGLGLSLSLGSGLEDTISFGLRRGGTALRALRRGHDLGESLEIARRVDDINTIRRARQVTPQFTDIRRNIQTTQQPVTPDNIEPLANFRSSELLRHMERNPLTTTPLPQFNYRTNSELRQVAINLGIIQPATPALTNQGLSAIQQVYGSTFARIGPSVPPSTVPDFFPTNTNIQLYDDLVQKQNSAIVRVMTSESGDLPDEVFQRLDDILINQVAPTADQRLQQLVDDVLPNRYVGGSMDDVAIVVSRSDELANASRPLRELEEEMLSLRSEILRQGRKLDTSHAPYVRRNIADEINNVANYGDVVPGTTVEPMLSPAPFNGEGLHPVVSEGWYHGTRQMDIQGINLNHGGAHEYGVGLYLTRDESAAQLYAIASRTQNVPVPGTTRLQPDGSGLVYNVTPEIRNPLELDGPLPEEVSDLFVEAVRETYSPGIARDYAESIRSVPGHQMWVKLREMLGEMNGTVSELQYREFSTNLADKLVGNGYDALIDNARNIMVGLPREGGQLPLRVNNVSGGIGNGNKTFGWYTRHFTDAELARDIPSPVTEAWELQSRMAFGNSLMEESLRVSNEQLPAFNDALRQYIESDRRVIDTIRRNADMETLEFMTRHQEDAINTPGIRTIFEEGLDNPCL